MYADVTFAEAGNRLFVTVSPKMRPMLIIGLLFEGILYFGFAVFFAYLAISMFFFKGFFFLGVLALCVFGAIYFLVSRTYFKRLFNKEVLIVDKTSMELIEKWLFNTTSQRYELDRISYFGYAGREDFSENPVSQRTYDITGIGTLEKEVQFMIEDGTIGFFYEGVSRRFGKRVAEEDIELIQEYIRTFTGKDLSKPVSLE